MLRLRMSVPADLSDQVVATLADDPSVSALARMRGASITPAGDVVTADVAREGTNAVVERLLALDLHRVGTLQVENVETWMSRAGRDAETRTPGASADAVVWPEVTLRAYSDTELNWTFVSFMCLATLMASIAIVVDSQILVVGAMVLGPEFGAVAALGVALVRRRVNLLRLAVRALVVGFVVAIAFACVAALVGRGLGWVTPADVSGSRPGTAFIYEPDKWSVIVAVVAGAAGVLSLTSARMGGLTGVFISVTTIPAAGNVALGLAFGAFAEVRGSALQLVVNLTGMAVAGWATLLLQQTVWRRVSERRARLIDRHPRLRRAVIRRP
ncbi:DUF389 domain-containing protein [Cellulomonas alba]|uniref:DUF389 domain-containing protein n=1 Tax=Cellulomonas alba TaxID=3053467 RepID=A0ABT7SG31_9CELL|nr:DUF389 domain-containing protein [Cellulomonas alba]MDM7855160.1 DUF389 domain-containing protein [Cellulomonas alba]